MNSTSILKHLVSLFMNDVLTRLLDTGSSAYVRNTAADQLADVQKNHPEDLLSLLSRVFPYLRSKKWDTRISSARALGGIVANASLWDPNSDDNVKLEENVKIEELPDIKLEDGDRDTIKQSPESETPKSVEALDSDNLLSFSTFDLRNVIKHGGQLLGSAGKEYDDPYVDLDPVERLRRQKINLKSKLGMGGEYFDDDLLNEVDINVKSLSPATTTPVATKPSPATKGSSVSPAPAAAASPPETASNARLRAMAKRRAKFDAKNNLNKVRIVDLSASSAARRIEKDVPSNGSSPSLIEPKVEYSATEQAHNDKVVIETKAPKVSPLVSMQAAAGSEKIWPFEGICELLMVDLFDEAWEIRHGSALGLREIIKVHGAGAGRIIGASNEENDKRNSDWLEDLSCRLCCIFALDRFGDYVADQVVAPVRESAAQTLAALLLHMPDSVVKSTFNVLKQLVLQNDLDLPFTVWEACHGGMLGLRYLVSVRTDILFKEDSYLDGLITCVLHGLQESDDDVQAMSAAALIPIASEFVELRPNLINTLLEVVWDCLGDLKDDLSASIGNVMDVLAKLCASPKVLEVMKESAESDPCKSFSQLVPRLFPFFRHSITKVRQAVLRALLTFLSVEGSDSKGWIDAKALRLVFQNLLVEQNEGVLDLSLDLWNSMLDEIKSTSTTTLTELLSPYIVGMISLLMTPIGTSRNSFKMDTSLLIKPSGAVLAPISNGANIDKSLKRKRKSTSNGKTEEPIPTSIQVDIDSPMISGDVTLIEYPVFLRTKVAGARALGKALAYWDQSTMMDFESPFIVYLSSNLSTQKLVTSLLLEEYGKAAAGNMNEDFKKTLLKKLWDLLNNESEVMYKDLTPYLKAVRTQCQALFSVFIDVGKLSRGRIPQIAVVVQGEAEAGPDAFSIANAEQIAGDTFDKLKRHLPSTSRFVAAQALTDSHRSLKHSIDEAKEAKTSRDVSVNAAAAAAHVAIGSLPAKLNPIIRSLMDSVKSEEVLQLQRRAAVSIADLVALFIKVNKKGAADKIIKNLSAFLCVDTSEVPEFHPNQHFEDIILSLRKEESKTDPADIIAHQKEVKAARIKRNGAQIALESLAGLFGKDLFTSLPKLTSCMFGALMGISAEKNGFPESIYDQDSTLGQDIIDNLSIIRALLPNLDHDLHPEYLPLIRSTLESKLSVLRYAAAKCFATVCSVITIEGISSLVDNVIPMVSNALNLHARQGAIECIYHLAAVMGPEILPYVVFLIVPVLGRMSDSDKDVRLLATTTFASIIKLVPLESGIPDPPGMSAKLLEGRDREREFISQMLDVSKVKPFALPVAIKADLRRYQQDGVNWLAFLNKYHLHGILCDDMGLGKTLQTICIVASDHHLRAEDYAKTRSSDTRKLPSLIVCPPTLTGHWQHELLTYAPFLSVLVYVGPPSLRVSLVDQFEDFDVVVTSYDIARNDVKLISAQPWNYCVLDEGHIIKNAASKLTQAVKTFNANHRLILSGTPIQNNVLELWSLFDFLMPGFLGTEKVFNDRFAKPIAASRNSKGSSKEQEAGALALEALHKQVLPFLLRRLKEDVLSDLPPKIIQDYYCELSDLQKQLYENFAKKEKSEIEGDVASESKEGKQHIFQALQYMRKLCNHPALVLNPKHPQYELIKKQLSAKNQSIRDISHAPKLQALGALLMDCGIGAQSNLNPSSGNSNSKQAMELSDTVISQHRALIFCQLKDMLDMVENDLLKKYMPSVTYMRLDGSTDARKRHDVVQQFNGDPSIDVLLLTTHVGGLGLNLTGADTVIFVEHDWNPMNDLQAMDRAHRIGQKKVVNVYRLITKNTLEEKIMGLQKFKMNIASTVVNQQNSGLSSMNTGQLLDLFEVPGPEALSQEATAGKPEEGLLDETGQLVKGKSSNPISELGELWDEKEYEEEYNLDSFIQTLKN